MQQVTLNPKASAPDAEAALDDGAPSPLLDGPVVESPVESLVVLDASLNAKGPSDDLSELADSYGHLVFVGLMGKVLAFDVSDHIAISGNSFEGLLWKRTLCGPFQPKMRLTLNFVPEEDLLFVCHAKVVYCLDPRTGDVRWQRKVNHESNYMLCLSEGLYVVGLKHLHLLDKATGEVLQHCNQLRSGNTIGRDQSSVCLDPLDSNILLICNCFSFSRYGRSEQAVLDRYRERSRIGVPTLLPFDAERLLIAWDGYLNILPRTGLTSSGGVGTYGRQTRLGGVQKHGVSMLLVSATYPLLVVSYGNHLVGLHPITHQIYWELRTFDCRVPITMAGQTPVMLGRPQNSLNYSNEHKLLYVSGGAIVQAIRIDDDEEDHEVAVVWETRLTSSEPMYVSTWIDEAKGMIFCGCFGFFYGLDLLTGEIRFVNHLKGLGRGHLQFAGLDQSGEGKHNLDAVAQPFLQACYS